MSTATAIKERPILFSGDMVRAILVGRKTQTRRTTRLDKVNQRPDDWATPSRCESDGRWVFTAERGPAQQERVLCPYGVPGDRLWLRETRWRNGGYVATDPPNFKNEGKLSSIHMPRWASRITLEVVSVRVERVQGINADDCLSEGVRLRASEVFPDVNTSWKLHRQFEFLWDSIYASKGYGWDANPWVWVVEFKVASP